ncbi:MAG: hypothetical protein HC785_30330 [Calothrix sp. CSU_2_0]|nr:hypothetical protein [Calothrix sp. CSU_2_0]
MSQLTSKIGRSHLVLRNLEGWRYALSINLRLSQLLGEFESAIALWLSLKVTIRMV